MRLLPNYPKCFICGQDNPTGIHACFYRDQDRVVVHCTFAEQHCGYEGMVHGGLISALLDEALGRIVASITGKMVMTGELTVRFHKPVPVNATVEISATIDEYQRRPNLFTSASGVMLDRDNQQKYASAKGRFVAIPDEKYSEILTTLRLQGNSRAVTLDDL